MRYGLVLCIRIRFNRRMRLNHFFLRMRHPIQIKQISFRTFPLDPNNKTGSINHGQRILNRRSGSFFVLSLPGSDNSFVGRRTLMRSVEDLTVFSCFGPDDPQHSPPHSWRGSSEPRQRVRRRMPTFVVLMNFRFTLSKNADAFFSSSRF
jgi:hypothetical protein